LSCRFPRILGAITRTKSRQQSGFFFACRFPRSIVYPERNDSGVLSSVFILDSFSLYQLLSVHFSVKNLSL
jgi:hypothetical protein